MRTLTIASLLLCAVAFAGCGGGNDKSPSRTQVVVRLGTEGNVAVDGIRGVQVTVKLPAGVTVAADSNGKVAPPIVAPSGVAQGASAVVAAHYTAATTPGGGAVKIIVVKSSGFGAGEFGTITCDVASGTTPSTADFRLADLKPVDQNGAFITALSGRISVDSR